MDIEVSSPLIALLKGGSMLKPSIQKFITLTFGLFLFLLPGWAVLPQAWTQPPEKISKEHLLKILGQPGMLILDVRTPKNWQESHRMIKGAIRKPPKNFREWVDDYTKDQMLVLYCA